MNKKFLMSISSLALAFAGFLSIQADIEQIQNGNKPGILGYLGLTYESFLIIIGFLLILLFVLIIASIGGIFESFRKKDNFNHLKRFFSFSLLGLSIIEIAFGNTLLSSLFLLNFVIIKNKI